MYREIFIAGLGNIGRRHLQAAYNVNIIKDFYCYDYSKPTLDDLSEFIQANSMNPDRFHKFDNLFEFVDKIKFNSIIIVATTANGRLELLKELIAKKPAFIVVEKPVCQSYEDYIKIMELARSQGVEVFVNFIAHAQKVYNDIALLASESNSFLMTTKMPKWGISTVGIHQLELYMWLSGDTNFKYDFSKRFSVYEQKRSSFFDIEGAISIEGENGSAAYISNVMSDEGPSSIQFCLDDITITVYETLGKYTIADESGIEVKDLKIKFVSQYMTEVLKDLIFNESCYLPDLDRSFLAHQVLFDYLALKGYKNLNVT